jgi:transcriptional regulator with XRE-family HTH domain
MPLVESFSKGIGPALGAMRRRAGLTQAALAEKLKLTQSRLSQAEKSGAAIPNHLVDSYLEGCGCDMFDLALAFLDAQTPEDDLVALALRAYHLGDIPDDLRQPALEALRSHRRLLEGVLRKVEELED